MTCGRSRAPSTSLPRTHQAPCPWTPPRPAAGARRWSPGGTPCSPGWLTGAWLSLRQPGPRCGPSSPASRRSSAALPPRGSHQHRSRLQAGTLRPRKPPTRPPRNRPPPRVVPPGPSLPWRRRPTPGLSLDNLILRPRIPRTRAQRNSGPHTRDGLWNRPLPHLSQCPPRLHRPNSKPCPSPSTSDGATTSKRHQEVACLERPSPTPAPAPIPPSLTKSRSASCRWTSKTNSATFPQR
mmetsp:Transcript_28039/g.82093  ORF Transcript_28039/g.82093 Transcript_28039/m.82093 type:complete len:238 (+) Transcript_28039:908-1621(+)